MFIEAKVAGGGRGGGFVGERSDDSSEPPCIYCSVPFFYVYMYIYIYSYL